MHTVVETAEFNRSAKNTQVSDEELEMIKALLGHYPTAGDVIPGTGGARKVRFPARGKGKSGGYRIITFYSGKDIPVFLLDVYAKDEKDNLTLAQKNRLRNRLKSIVSTYRSGSL